LWGGARWRERKETLRLGSRYGERDTELSKSLNRAELRIGEETHIGKSMSLSLSFLRVTDEWMADIFLIVYEREGEGRNAP
jgi:hypothetical protein